MIIAFRLLINGSVIFTVWRTEQPPFWSRNRDQLVVGILVALIGAAVGAFVTVLIQG